MDWNDLTEEFLKDKKYRCEYCGRPCRPSEVDFDTFKSWVIEKRLSPWSSEVVSSPEWFEISAIYIEKKLPPGESNLKALCCCCTSKLK